MSAWDLFRDPRWVHIEKLESAAQELKSAAFSDADRLHMLELRVNRLAMLTAALWELLKKTSSLTEEELTEALANLPAQTPVIATVITPQEPHCPACQHKISPTVSRCIYCGAAVTPQRAAE